MTVPERPFEVWAPRPDRVRLLADDRVHPMIDAGDGWWRPADAGAIGWRGGIDYGYLLDDDPVPVADPRSRRQRAGVDVIELLPVNAVNGRHNWGYDGVFWSAVHEAIGGPDAYGRFVDAAHDHGLAVAQDVVYNHLGPSGNVLPRFGPYIHDTAENPWGASMNLDGPRSHEVRRLIIDNAVMWLRDFGVDMLRLDAVHALDDRSRPHLLADLAEEVDALAIELGRPLTLIAESDLNDPIVIEPRADGGYGLTAQWSDDYHHAAHVALTGETGGYYDDFASLAALGAAMQRGFVHDGRWSSFRGREHGAPIDLDRTPLWRLVTFTQNHDQIGNRAAGDRLAATLDDRGLDLAAALCLLSPFTPMLFMGEEWGASTPWQFFTSHPEPQLAAAVAEGRVAEFAAMGWDEDAVPDPQDPATLRRSRLDWDEPAAPRHARILERHRALIRLRREVPALTDPRFATVRCGWDDEARWFRLDRDGVSVLWNFADEERSVPVGGASAIRFATGAATVVGDAVAVSARSVAVVEWSPRLSSPVAG